MPVFDEEKTVAEAVRAVLAQPIVAELICIDDCSRDGSLGILESLATQEPRMRWQAIKH